MPDCSQSIIMAISRYNLHLPKFVSAIAFFISNVEVQFRRSVENKYNYNKEK